MTILNFITEFPDERSCKFHFKQLREKQGIKCKTCNCPKHNWLKAKWQWQCSNCEYRTTLKSGTMLQNSNLPLKTWYLAMAFMVYSKKGISACEMQRQLNHRRYNTIWSLMHRTRNIMGNRDARYQLKGMIEFDEAFFAKAMPDGIKLKRGKSSKKKQSVAVIAESAFLEELDTGKKSKQCRHYKT